MKGLQEIYIGPFRNYQISNVNSTWLRTNLKIKDF
jgi:hypothetical protein